MSEDYTWNEAEPTRAHPVQVAALKEANARLAARVMELEAQLNAAIVSGAQLERENAELRVKLKVVQVYARGIYGEVPPISFEDWYALIQREVQP